MKLIYCPYCGDVFQLRMKKMRECECGKIKGRYLDQSLAEVSANAISLAIGNGDLQIAIGKMLSLKDAYKPGGELYDREDYQRKAKLDYAWVRPNDGPGNPHTKIIEENTRELVYIHKNLIIFSNPLADKKAIEEMAENLDFFVAPAYKEDKGFIITDANHRAQAAILAGYEHIPCVLLTKQEYDYIKFSKTKSIDLKVYLTDPPKFINEL